jgi:hypothetical protein
VTDDHLNNSPEIWKAVPGFEGHYDVSNQGRIRSYWRRIGKGIGNGTEAVLDGQPQKILKPVLSRGYHLVNLYKEGTLYQSAVHKLVLETFVGPCPPGMEGCHNNGKPKNNCLYNLRWDFPINNSLDRIKHGTSGKGEKNAHAKLTEDQVNQIRKMSSHGHTQEQLGDLFSVCRVNIHKIIHRKTWKHV